MSSTAANSLGKSEALRVAQKRAGIAARPDLLLSPD